MTSRLLNPTTPGFLLSEIQGMMTANEELVIQAITTGTYFHFNEVPTGLINGSNVAFTLAANPNPDTSLEVYLNGVHLQVTTDYTLSGTTLTMLVAPETDMILQVNYIVSPV
jgi:hypothetical protein